MGTYRNKELLIKILEVLNKHTDENHPLTQKEILDILRINYDPQVDRKTVARNLDVLDELGYVECDDQRKRTILNAENKPEESTLHTSYYLVHRFTDSELRLLIDGLLFSKHIPYNQCKELVEKLRGLSSKHFGFKVRHVYALPETKAENTDLFYTIEILDEAIANEKQVAFTYNKYGTDKKLHPRRSYEYIVNPYQMAATNGRYYLIGNNDKYSDLVNFRVDRITGIRLLDTPVKPKEQVKGAGKNFSLSDHMAEHPYMFGGESVIVTFRMSKDVLDDVIDWFGTDVAFFDETVDEVTARVTVNWHAMRHWALQYCRHITILSPTDLAQKVKEDLQTALKNYGA